MRWSDPYIQQYSPSIVGTGGLILYVGLGLLVYLGLTLPPLVWWSGLVLLALGLALEILTRRLIYVRFFQATVLCSFVLTFGVLLWTIISQGNSHYLMALLAALITGTLAATGVGGYRNNSAKRLDISINPAGPYATLNARTGEVMRDSSPRAIQAREREERGLAWLRWAGPLIAGFSMAMAGSLRGEASSVVIALVSFVASYGSAAGLGAIWFYFVAARRWETNHDKKIYVTR